MCEKRKAKVGIDYVKGCKKDGRVSDHGTCPPACSVCGKRHSFAELATMIGDRLDDVIAAINAADMQIPPPETKTIRLARYPKLNAEHDISAVRR